MSRIETIVRTLYKFDELSERAQQAALSHLWDSNVACEWWQSTEEDAARVNLKLEFFDIHRGTITGLMTDPEGSAVKVLLEHGPDSDTRGTAYDYLRGVMAVNLNPGMWEEVEEGEDAILTYKADAKLEEESEDYRRALSEDYLSILRKEYEYLTSEEAIKETIMANDWEFLDNGNPSWWKR